jgi:flagellar capping protein FliD
MRRIAAYQSSTGSIRSLSDLGIEFDTAGHASFDQTTFDQLTPSQIADAFKFIGSATSPLGGFSATLEQLSDPITGLIKAEHDGLTNTDQSIQSQMTTLTDRITAMQTNLAARLQKADALLAELQSQQQAITASLQGLNLVLYGKNPNQVA